METDKCDELCLDTFKSAIQPTSQVCWASMLGKSVVPARWYLSLQVHVPVSSSHFLAPRAIRVASVTVPSK